MVQQQGNVGSTSAPVYATEDEIQIKTGPKVLLPRKAVEWITQHRPEIAAYVVAPPLGPSGRALFTDGQTARLNANLIHTMHYIRGDVIDDVLSDVLAKASFELG